MTAPDPKTVREIARKAAQRALRLGCNAVLEDAVREYWPEARTTVEFYERCDTIRIEYDRVAETLTWPDKQQPAEATGGAGDGIHEITVVQQHPMIGKYWQSHCSCGCFASNLHGSHEAAEQAGQIHVRKSVSAEVMSGEQVQDGTRDDSFAMVAEGAPAGPARAVAEYWRDYATAVSNGGRFTDWTQIAQVAAWILAAMDAEFEQLQDDGDVREWLTYMAETIDNEEDSRICSAIHALLDQRTALAARVAELTAECEADTRMVRIAVDIIEGLWNGDARPADVIEAHEQLHARFVDRIAALDADADGGAG